MPNVQDGLQQGADPNAPDAFSEALAAQVGAERREPAAPATHAPHRDSADSIRAQVSATEADVATRDVQSAIDQGAPSKPEADTSLEKLADVKIDGESFTGKQVYDALGAVGTDLEAAEEELAVAREDYVLEGFHAAVDEDAGDGLVLAEGIASLSEAVDRGELPAEEFVNLVRWGVAESVGIDLTDMDSADVAYLEEALEAVGEVAVQIYEARRADEARYAAGKLIPEAAEQRAREATEIIKSWARDSGFRSDAQADEALQAAQAFLEQEMNINLEALLRDPQSWDPKLFESALRGSHATLAEEAKLRRDERIRQEVAAPGTDIEAGLTFASPWGQVPIRDSRLPVSQLDPDRVSRRAAFRHATAADIKRSLLDSSGTSVEEALRKGA